MSVEEAPTRIRYSSPTVHPRRGVDLGARVCRADFTPRPRTGRELGDAVDSIFLDGWHKMRPGKGRAGGVDRRADKYEVQNLMGVTRRSPCNSGREPVDPGAGQRR